MKKLLPILALVFAVVACKRSDNAVCSGNTVCTQEFRAVTITVKDGSANPVKLDTSWTVRNSTGETFKTGFNTVVPGRGGYEVLSDNAVPDVKGTTDVYYFKGFLNGQQIINEAFTISADCCHVSLISGHQTVSVP